MDQTVSDDCVSVELTVMNCLSIDIHPAYGLTGLSRGGQQVSKCKEVFGKAVKLLVELASLQVGMLKSLVTYRLIILCVYVCIDFICYVR